MMLLGVIVLIAAWKRAIAVSDKLSARRWELIAVFSAALFVLSVAGYRYSAEPSVQERETVTHRNKLLFMAYGHDFGANYNLNAYVYYCNVWATYGESDIHEWSAPSGEFSSQRAEAFITISVGGFYGEWSLQAHEPAHTGEHLLPDLTRFFRDASPVVVHVEAPERNDFAKGLLFWASLFGMIASPILGIAANIFAWISLHRKRAEAILMRLEIEKKNLEIEQLRLELDQARREYEQSKKAASKIIVASS
jgi:hypothetical protein